MIIVISTFQKKSGPELLPRPDPHGGGTSARAAISIYIIAAIVPVKLRERFAVWEFSFVDAIGRPRSSFASFKGWFDMRDLGMVLDHEEPQPHPVEDRQQ
jgi:hypothetical protein